MRLQNIFRSLALIVFTLSISCVTSQVDARQIFPNEDWYYGYRQTPGDEPDTVILESYDLVAYKLNGEVVTVMEGLQDIPRSFNLDANHTLVVSQEGEQQLYYEVQGTEAVPLVITVEDEDANTDAAILLSYRAPYAVFHTARPGLPLVVADLEKDTVELTEHAVLYDITTCCVLSDTGTLQYFGQMMEEDGMSFGLIERDLATGEESVLFTDPELQIGYANQSGDRWLLRVNVPDIRQVTTIIWQGNTELSRETGPLQERFAWVDDALYRDDVLCEQNCEITVEAPDAEVTTIPVIYPDAGEGSGRFFFPRTLLSDGALIGELQDPDQRVKITTDGDVETFGYVNYTGLVSSGTAPASLSERFVVVTTEPDSRQFAVVDTETGTTVIESDAEDEPSFVSVFFFPQGIFAISYGDEESAQYYRLSDQHLFDLPVESTSYFDVLDDDTLFYVARGEDTPFRIGLYHLETEEQQTIVEGIQPVQLRQAIR